MPNNCITSATAQNDQTNKEGTDNLAKLKMVDI